MSAPANPASHTLEAEVKQLQAKLKVSGYRVNQLSAYSAFLCMLFDTDLLIGWMYKMFIPNFECGI